MFGFAKVTTLDLLEHLEETYGTVIPDDLDKNLANLCKVWTSYQPIEDLFLQLHIAQDFAANTNPITDASIIGAYYMLTIARYSDSKPTLQRRQGT
jgi:hypothetical protein